MSSELKKGINSMSKPNYSIVIPVYNSKHTLRELCDRIASTFKQIMGTYEIILVDDCSPDNSWNVMEKLHVENERIKRIHLLKNFGQHNATLCGLSYAKGDYIIILDDDLQHPPEEIPKLIEKINEGYLAVYGKYIVKHHNKIENFLSNRFQLFIHRILKIPDKIYISSFAIFKSEVIKNATSIKCSYVFLPALISQSIPINKLGNVDVVHHPRKVGKSNYNFLKYLKLASNLIFNYSSLPLLIVSTVGIIISLLSVFYGSSIVIRKLIDPTYGLMGWNSLMVVITFLGGSIMMSMGVVGEYLRRILAETSYGQQYAIGEMEL